MFEADSGHYKIYSYSFRPRATL